VTLRMQVGIRSNQLVGRASLDLATLGLKVSARRVQGYPPFINCAH